MKMESKIGTRINGSEVCNTTTGTGVYISECKFNIQWSFSPTFPPPFPIHAYKAKPYKTDDLVDRQYFFKYYTIRYYS